MNLKLRHRESALRVMLVEYDRIVTAIPERLQSLLAGAKDNGVPGIRTIYHPNYYGAFVIGPDGHNIEAVCHQPEP